MGCVYIVTNIVNGKKYVGRTTDTARRRWYGHLRSARKGSGFYLHSAIRKYGEDNFTVETIQESDDEEYLSVAEMFTIDKLGTRTPNGYNLTDGGEGSFGRIVSEESRRKASETNKGQKQPPRTEAGKISFAEKRRGHEVTDETRAKISKAMTGKNKRPQTEEERKKKSEAQKKRHLREADMAKRVAELESQAKELGLEI